MPRHALLLLLVLGCAGREGPVDPAELAPFYRAIVEGEAGGTLGFVDHYWVARGDSFARRPLPEDVRRAVLEAGGEVVPAGEWDDCRRGLRLQEVCELLRREEFLVVQIEEPRIENGEIRVGLAYTYAGPPRPCARLYSSTRTEYGLRRRGSGLEVGSGYRLVSRHNPRYEPPGFECPPEEP
jgi:hypothetical protein